MTAVRPQAKVIRREFAAHFCLGLVARVQGGDACVRTTRARTFTTAQSRSRTHIHDCTIALTHAHAHMYTLTREGTRTQRCAYAHATHTRSE